VSTPTPASAEAQDLVISRLVRAPRRAVWRAWSDPVLLKEWWCPRPWMTEVRAFELRAGGAFHTFMHGPDGGRSDNPGCFLEVVPFERIVFTSMLTAGRQAAGVQLQSARVLLLMRRAPDVADRGAPGRTRHPACSGAAMGAGAADPSARAAGGTA
jgi:hypothetical protein